MSELNSNLEHPPLPPRPPQLIDEIAKAKDMGYKKAVKTTGGVQQFGGTSTQSVEGTVHSATDDEKVGFVDWCV